MNAFEILGEYIFYSAHTNMMRFMEKVSSLFILWMTITRLQKIRMIRNDKSSIKLGPRLVVAKCPERGELGWVGGGGTALRLRLSAASLCDTDVRE